MLLTDENQHQLCRTQPTEKINIELSNIFVVKSFYNKLFHFLTKCWTGSKFCNWILKKLIIMISLHGYEVFLLYELFLITLRIYKISVTLTRRSFNVSNVRSDK